MVILKFMPGIYVAMQNTQKGYLFPITTQNLIGVEFRCPEVIST